MTIYEEISKALNSPLEYKQELEFYRLFNILMEICERINEAQDITCGRDDIIQLDMLYNDLFFKLEDCHCLFDELAKLAIFAKDHENVLPSANDMFKRMYDFSPYRFNKNHTYQQQEFINWFRFHNEINK